ncbi:MAG: hypothetical protein JRN32_01770 [Nitrososphaerota archaeon]|nr:hypothetical protein [Nitrososphaerota archaeon]
MPRFAGRNVGPRTPEKTIQRIRDERRRGKTYRQIEKEFGVSRWITHNYLKGIVKDTSQSIALKSAAVAFLQESGFHTLESVFVMEGYVMYIIAKRGTEEWCVNVRSRSISQEGSEIFMGTIKFIESHRNAVVIMDVKSDATEVTPPMILEIKRVMW